MYEILIKLPDDFNAEDAEDFAENVLHEMNMDVTILRGGVEITTLFAD